MKNQRGGTRENRNRSRPTTQKSEETVQKNPIITQKMNEKSRNGTRIIRKQIEKTLKNPKKETCPEKVDPDGNRILCENRRQNLRKC